MEKTQRLAENLQRVKELIVSWKNARYCSIIGLLLVNIYVSIRGEIDPGLFDQLLSFSGGNGSHINNSSAY